MPVRSRSTERTDGDGSTSRLDAAALDAVSALTSRTASSLNSSVYCAARSALPDFVFLLTWVYLVNKEFVFRGQADTFG